MNVTTTKTIRSLLTAMKVRGYYIAERPYELNLVGVRSDSTVPNKFDDRIYAFYKNDKGKWEGKDFASTTDPSTYWLQNPMNVDGTAILKQGQWEYKIGSHRGYKALNQRGKVTVIRDYDRNAILDFNNGKETTGYYGINVHRASSTGTSTNVDRWSAGCQVIANANDFLEMMAMVQRSVDKYGDSKFYYTLLDQRAMARTGRRYGLYIGLIIGGLLAFYGSYKLIYKKPFLPKFRK